MATAAAMPLTMEQWIGRRNSHDIVNGNGTVDLALHCNHLLHRYL